MKQALYGIPLRKPGTEIAHVWVFAENAKQLEVRLKTLERIRFVQLTSALWRIGSEAAMTASGRQVPDEPTE